MPTSSPQIPEFLLAYEDEPHKTRRKEILAKYPQVSDLMIVDPWFKYDVVARVAFQLVVCYVASSLSWPLWFVVTYALVGTINHSLLLAIHEISHNAAFGAQYPLYNKLFGMLANLPIGLPMFLKFRYYHLIHHKNMGELIDPDLPSLWEVNTFKNRLGKLLFIALQPFCYGLRPMLLFPTPLTFLEILNISVQLAFDWLVWRMFGLTSILTLLMGSLLGTGIHPMSGHFISEHYTFNDKQETYSYYGSLNFIAYNVGYHNEHHDFPNVPGRLLPKLRKIAPEYYGDDKSYNSWISVLYNFVMDPRFSLNSRVFRESA